MSTKTPLPPKPDNLPGRGSIWQHSKGTFYRVIGYSRHSENPDQWLVTYRPLTGDGDDWTRALVSTEQNGWPGFLDNFTIPAFQGDKGWHRFKHIGGPLTWKDEPAPEELCEDEGCPHYGTPHVCVSVTESSGNVFADLGLPDADRRRAEADARIDAMPPEPQASELQVKASSLVGFEIALGSVLVMKCATLGQDHHDKEHFLPGGALAIVADIEIIGGEQGLGVHLTIPVDPSSDFEDDDAVHITNTFDESDTQDRFAFRLATDEERAKLHPSWLHVA